MSTSTADVDGPELQLSWTKPRTLKKFILEHGCEEYRELDMLRKEGFNDELLKRELRSQSSRRRQAADESTADDDVYWLGVMSSALEHIDKKINCIPHVAGVRFLDLGCCPGGFSDYVLRNPKAYGVGVSLEVEHGGHGLAIPFPQKERFEMHWADLTYFKTCCPSDKLNSNTSAPRTQAEMEALLQAPFDLRGFQLVMMDGQHRRPQESASTRPWDIDRLLISQLIIALGAVDRGGTVIMKLSHLESSVTARLVYMLDNISRNMVAFKPYVHGTRGSFYAVARGVGLGAEGWKKFLYRDELKKVWWRLTYGGVKQEGRWLKEKDLNFIVGYGALREEYLGRLITLGRGAWRAQSCALRRTYAHIRKSEAAQSQRSISPVDDL